MGNTMYEVYKHRKYHVVSHNASDIPDGFEADFVEYEVDVIRQIPVSDKKGLPGAIAYIFKKVVNGNIVVTSSEVDKSSREWDLVTNILLARGIVGNE